MPAPSKAQIRPLATAALQGAGLRGDAASALAGALSEMLGQAMTLFLSQAVVAPGIPAAASPPAGNGSTAGPGMLMPPPAGGPTASQLEGLVNAALQGEGLRGDAIGDLAKAIAATVAVGLQMFTTMVKVAPGIPVAGFVTSAPGMLMPPAPDKGQLRPAASGFARQFGLSGAHGNDTIAAVAEATAGALALMVPMAKVAPGIACTPAATAAPGRLM